MERERSNWGGARPGGGRPPTNRNVSVNFRISQEAADLLNKQKNKSEYIDNLIKEAANV